MLTNKDDEQILVIKSDIIFKDPPRPGEAGGKWQGLKKDNLDYYVDLIKKNAEFKRRGDMENDSSFKQIIPYILFSFRDNFFAFKYLGNAGEKRLIDTYNLGVGGHINKEDVNGNKDILEAGMMREWNEEMSFNGNILRKKLIGILNDDSRPVESVHLGLLYNFVGDSPKVFIKETDKMEGKLVNLKNLWEYIKENPTIWTKIIYKEYISKLI